MTTMKKYTATNDANKTLDEVAPPMDGAISATASIATVGAAVGAAIGIVGGPAGIIAGAAIGGSVGALAGVEATDSANHAEEVANEEGVQPSKPIPKAS